MRKVFVQRRSYLIPIAIGIFMFFHVLKRTWDIWNNNAALPVTAEKAIEASSTPRTVIRHRDHAHSVDEAAPHRESEANAATAFVGTAASKLDDGRPLSLDGDIEMFHDAYLAIQERIEKIKNGSMNLRDAYAHIDGYAFNSDWTAYLRIYVHQELGQPVTAGERMFFISATEDLEGMLNKQWKKQGGEWSRRVAPIQETILWAKANAPSEYEVIRGLYYDLARQKGGNPILGQYKDLADRTQALYDAFYETLSALPPDSRIFTEYLGAGQAPPPAGMTPAARVIDPPAPSGAPERPNAPERAAAPPPEPPSGDPRPADAAAELERFDLHEGLRRLAEADKAWAESVAEWARARETARRGEAPPTPPAPPEPPDDNDDNPPFPPR